MPLAGRIREVQESPAVGFARIQDGSNRRWSGWKTCTDPHQTSLTDQISWKLDPTVNGFSGDVASWFAGLWCRIRIWRLWFLWLMSFLLLHFPSISALMIKSHVRTLADDNEFIQCTDDIMPMRSNGRQSGWCWQLANAELWQVTGLVGGWQK